ncbi:FMN-binding negative transcriptional regulator [Peribacillus deserti]|uniref:Protease n=1 Tax=Peribacillus deserti TaxID=673318 RepID=A0A2N5M0I4_9BACI|nr:FMN-binding negative transcriptional regulator [Peribacillus deserti]PLT27884.1 protease [Peribacillus deserti]
MYIPKYYKVTDINEITEFVQTNSFGTIVTTVQGKPIAAHVPLLFNQQGEDYYITGHLAYGNPLWKTLETSENVLVIYQGPHAYISSSWYEHENVPTWNYQSVHIYGTASLLNEQELKQDLTLLLQKYENHRENPVLWEKLSPKLLEKELKGIVGFKIKVQEIQAAYKLSQNRNETDYLNIVDRLEKEGHYDSSQMAEVMKKNMEK